MNASLPVNGRVELEALKRAMLGRLPYREFLSSPIEFIFAYNPLTEMRNTIFSIRPAPFWNQLPAEVTNAKIEIF